jgi:hypothetical protein
MRGADGGSKKRDEPNLAAICACATMNAPVDGSQKDFSCGYGIDAILSFQ